ALAAWFRSFTGYKGKAGGSALPAWLEMHRGGWRVIDRKNGDRPTLFIPRAAVGVTGTIQPGSLSRILTPDFFDCGCTARVLLAMPPKMEKKWREVEIAPEGGERSTAALKKLWALDFGTASDGEAIPIVLKLSKQAKKTWICFYNQWAKEQAAAEGDWAAALSKLEGYAARFALLHHCVVNCNTSTQKE